MLNEYERLILTGRLRKRAKGMHKHRIIPGYEGGKYTADNVIYLTRAEHIRVHRLRWELFGNRRDLLACKLLGEKLSDEEWLLCAKAGGNISGKKQAENKTGVCGRSKAKMSRDGKKSSAAISMETRRRGGKTMGNWLKANGLGIFGIPPDIDRENRAKGGRAAFSKLSYHDRVKGTKGKVWITNGTRSLRSEPNAPLPDGFRLGLHRGMRATPTHGD